MRHFPKIFFVLIFSFLSISRVFADDPTVFQSVEIEHAFLTPGNIGGESILRLSIRNESAGPLTILGVESPSHRRSKILVKLNDKQYTELASLPLEQEEDLDLTSSHMIIQLADITQQFKINEKVRLTLVLANGELPFIAHVAQNKPRKIKRS